MAAKLRHITPWLEASLNGDTARVNSLVKLVRAEGMFTSGGRGRGAPDMVGNDFAVALVSALSIAAPTKAAADIESILNLKLFSIRTDPADGGSFRETTVWGDRASNFGLEDAFGNPSLPPEIPTLPRTARDALKIWAEHFASNPSDGVNIFDRLLLKSGANTSLELQIHGPEWGVGLDGWRNENQRPEEYAWVFKFEADATSINSYCREVETRLYSEALKSLAEIAFDGGENG